MHDERRLVISAGTADFYKYADGGWKTSWIFGRKDGEKRVAFVAGLSANLFVPLDADGDGPFGEGLADLQADLSLRAATRGQLLSLFVNEQLVSTTDIAVTWEHYVVAIPAAVLKLGDNRIRMTFRSTARLVGGKRGAAALESIVVAPLHAAAPVVATGGETALVHEVSFGGARRQAMVMPGPSRLSYYVQVPDKAQLSLAYASPAPAASVIVRMTKDGTPPRTIFAGPATGAWTGAAWDLSDLGGESVRVDLVSRGGGVAWASPVLSVRSSPSAGQKPPRRIDRIFVWMVDTLRADKLHVYNPATIVETPNYDAFAADATRFAWAQVPGTWSLPSHASILTGVYPTVHKATVHEARLSPQVPFIAEILKDAGYRTALFSSNGYVSGKWGFNRGWDEVRNFIRESLPNNADYLWKTARPWIEANGASPQFVYMATIEPHVAYTPSRRFLARYWNKPYHGPLRPALTGIQLGKIKARTLRLDSTDKAYLEALHNAEITQSDASFGTFVADLKSMGLYETSAVIVVSDHGDEFWEHGDVGHAQSVHQELVHVPLIIRAPGMFPVGKVVRADVEAMDLFPTFLELAGLKPSQTAQGSSLLALARGDFAADTRAAMSQNVSLGRGVKAGRYRLINTGFDHLELFDELRDPLEQKNLAASHPIALREMRNIMGLIVPFENLWTKRTWGTGANLNEAFYKATDAGQ